MCSCYVVLSLRQKLYYGWLCVLVRIRTYKGLMLRANDA
jgi:hypothetical protein